MWRSDNCWIASSTEVVKIEWELQQKYELEPSQEELAEALDIPTKEFLHNMSVAKRHLSLHAPIVQVEDSSNLLDVLESDTVDIPDSELVKTH